ncbi:MAG: dienelactone hydrolase family protein [Acidimicrobiales bacterium]
MSETAGSGYLIKPLEAANRRGVLVLHSWWGLTPFFRRLCDRLAEAGYVALAPDLLNGALPATPDEAEAALAALDINRAAALVLSSARAMRSVTDDPSAPIGVIGFSMGASWAMWLAARSPQEVSATVAFYGTQNADLAAAACAFQGHFAEFDALVSDDEVVELEAHLHLVGRPVEFHRYPGTSHWFFEADRELAHDPEAAALAWQRTEAFLARHLGGSTEPDAGSEPVEQPDDGAAAPPDGEPGASS